MSQWKMVGVDEMLLGYKATDDLAQNQDASQTFILVGPAGQGAYYDAATSLLPITILIGTEQENVTARVGVQADPGAAPTTGVSGSGSTLTTGNYKVAYAYRYGSGTNKGGTTLISPQATQAVTSGDNLDVTLPALPTGALSIDVYVSQAAGSSTLKFAANTTTTSVSITADPTGALVPAANTFQDTLVVARGVNSTAAASHSVATGIVKTIRDLQMPYTRQFTINPQTTEITFQGDGEQDYVSLHLGMRGQITADKWLTDIWEKIFGVTKETTPLPADETFRWMPETGNYPALRLRCILHAIDDTSGLDVAVRLEIPRAQIYPRPWQPMSANTAAKTDFDLSWTAQRTLVDLLGLALPGTLPARGIFYSIAQLSTALP